MPLECRGRGGNWCRHLSRGSGTLSVSTSPSQSMLSAPLLQAALLSSTGSRLLFHSLLSTAFPRSNAAFSTSCRSRNDAAPAKQIQSLGSTSPSPFSDSRPVCYFCGLSAFSRKLNGACQGKLIAARAAVVFCLFLS